MISFDEFILIWLKIPKEWRKNNSMRKRMKYYIFWILAAVTHVSCQNALIMVLRTFSSRYQSLLALGFPAIRELIFWIGKKIVKKCANGDETGAYLIFIYVISTNHTVYLCYIISSITIIACINVFRT